MILKGNFYETKKTYLYFINIYHTNINDFCSNTKI